jgi:hypothetical protein
MHIGMGLGLTGLRQVFNPLSLFSAGEQGAWYDPSDFASMYQDSAGTTPVTATGQPVGKINDKSGRGNHATQATAASRPVLNQDASGNYYLSFDGVDDGMATGSINFSATDKMTVWAGATGTASGTGMVAELSAIVDGNNGAFALYDTTGTLYAALRGSSGVPQRSYTVAAGAAYVTSIALDIAGALGPDEVKPRLNGAVPTLTEAAAGPAGTGNFGSYPLYLGRRGGASLPFNGRLYSLIVRGAASSAAQIASAERYVGARTGIAL